MNRTRTPIRIVTVVFALTMLAGYVVYSQRQQTRSVAPGSKSQVITLDNKTVSGTNQVPARTRDFLASSSKSIAPLIELHPATASNIESAIVPTSMVAPGSKSAPMFDLRQAPIQQQLKSPRRIPMSNWLTRTLAPADVKAARLAPFSSTQSGSKFGSNAPSGTVTLRTNSFSTINK